MGHLRLTIGYVKATVVHIRQGNIRSPQGNYRHFFSISKHKANTTELHPKVRQTCCTLFLKFLIFLIFFREFHVCKQRVVITVITTVTCMVHQQHQQYQQNFTYNHCSNYFHCSESLAHIMQSCSTMQQSAVTSRKVFVNILTFVVCNSKYSVLISWGSVITVLLYVMIVLHCMYLVSLIVLCYW